MSSKASVLQSKATPTVTYESVLADEAEETREAALEATVGHKVPFLMIGLYVASIAVASTHFLVYQLLNGRPTESLSISQSYIAAVSTALVFVFKACLVGSLWYAFTQSLWHAFRASPAKVSTIEDFTRILYDSWSLISWDAVRFRPLLYICGLLTWLVAVTTIFPPAALTVQNRSLQDTRNASVPVFDLGHRGDGTNFALQKNALFAIGDFGNYFIPRPTLNRLAKQSILLQSPLGHTSPCGQNCSYSIEMIGPSYRCSNTLQDPHSLPELSHQVWLANKGYDESKFFFQAKWASFANYTSQLNEDALLSMTCALASAMYRVHVRFQNGQPSYEVTVQPQDLLPSAPLNERRLFNPRALWYPNGTSNDACLLKKRGGTAPSRCELLHSTAEGDGKLVYDLALRNFTWNDSLVMPPGIANVSHAFVLSNVRAVHDAVAGALSGGATDLKSNFLLDNIDDSFKIMDRRDVPLLPRSDNDTMSNNTESSSLILESKMATFSTDDLTAISLNVTAEGLQQLLTNTTLSLLSIANTQQRVLVTTHKFGTVYVFSHPIYLILPYASALIPSLVFVVIGLRCLYRNGTPATAGSFLQIIRATRGSSALDAMVRDANLTQRDSKLKRLEIRYGIFNDQDPYGGLVNLGFGTEDELHPLR